MPHQCVHCGEIYPSGSKEILKGCKCGSHFFFYVKDEQMAKIRDKIIEIPEEEKAHIEKDIREIAGIAEDDAPVILDIESVRVVGAGKFEIDLVNLFKKNRPLIYKIEDGKYIIDLASALGRKTQETKSEEK